MMASDGWAAIAVKLGQPARYTGRLSSNKAIRKQQLIIDPEGIIGGSASTMYDPTVVQLSSIFTNNTFQITGGFVETKLPLSITPTLIPIENFFGASGTSRAAGVFGRETGYVQLFFGLSGSETSRAAPSMIPNLPGYVTVDEDGETGVNDTHSLIFDFIGDNPASKASYLIYATAPRTGTVPDQIVSGDDPNNPIPFDELGPARVVGSLESPPAVPLPPAVLSGLLLLSTMGVGAVLRHRRLLRDSQ